MTSSVCSDWNTLTRDEALTFVRDKLDIDDIEEKISQQPTEALDEIARNYQFFTPFQNVSLLSERIGTITVPCFEETKKKIFAGHGGVCFESNLFLCGLLQKLGYEAVMAAGCLGFDNGHAFVLVKNTPYRNATSMLDAGIFLPQFQAVPLDFDDESPVYNNGYILYKFTRENGVITRLNAKRGRDFVCSREFHTLDETVEWKPIFSFIPEGVDLSVFANTMKIIFTEIFPKKFLLVKYGADVVMSLEDWDASSETLSVTYRELRPSGHFSKRLHTMEEVEEYSRKLLPTFSRERISFAVTNYGFYKKYRTISGQ